MEFYFAKIKPNPKSDEAKKELPYLTLKVLAKDRSNAKKLIIEQYPKCEFLSIPYNYAPEDIVAFFKDGLVPSLLFSSEEVIMNKEDKRLFYRDVITVIIGLSSEEIYDNMNLTMKERREIYAKKREVDLNFKNMSKTVKTFLDLQQPNGFTEDFTIISCGSNKSFLVQDDGEGSLAFDLIEIQKANTDKVIYPKKNSK